MDPTILLIVGAVGLVGCVILLLLGMNMLRQERGGKEGAPVDGSTPDAAPALEPAKPAAAASGGSNPFLGVTARLSGSPARGSSHEVLRVLRDNLTGRLMLEIGGKRYASLNEVVEPEMRQALMTTLHDLEAYAGGALPQVAPAPRLPEPATTAAGPALAAKAARPAAEKPADYRPPPAPTMNPFKQMAVLREMAKNPPPPPKSITEQIDDVLQARIIGTPMIHRALHVLPGPRGDAIFEADGQSYSSVDDLPDVEVRDAFRAAIIEWESKR